jgi:hypothetical protein
MDERDVERQSRQSQMIKVVGSEWMGGMHGHEQRHQSRGQGGHRPQATGHRGATGEWTLCNARLSRPVLLTTCLLACVDGFPRPSQPGAALGA